MPRDDPQSQIRAIGKGVIQANLRLTKVLDRLDVLAPASNEAADAWLDPLLALMDGIERSLAPTALPAPRRRWWRRRPSGLSVEHAALQDGLRLLLDQAGAELSRGGVEALPTSGAFDPTSHRAIDRAVTTDPSLHNTIQRTWSRGYRRGDDVVRLAEVTVWSVEEEQDSQ